MFQYLKRFKGLENFDISIEENTYTIIANNEKAKKRYIENCYKQTGREL